MRLTYDKKHLQLGANIKKIIILFRFFAVHPSSSTTTTTTTTTTCDDSTSCTNDIGGPSPIPSPKSPPNHFDTMMEATGGPLGHSTLQVPKSPRTPRSMGHVIRHRFTKTFKPARCDLCTEYMFNGNFNFLVFITKGVYVTHLNSIQYCKISELVF